nr:hypothetical protein [Tanacetum cinerariifolium]
MHSQPQVQKLKIHHLDLPKAPSLNQKPMEILFMRRNQSSRLEILTRLKVKKGVRENPKGDNYPFDLSKPLPLITHGNRQSAPVEFFINNDLKYLQRGISTMTYTTSTTKIKAAQYDLPCIKDMARGIQSRGDVYSTKCILAVTHVSVMRKHGYGYLEEIVVRRADNALYKFKEGDFLRLWINDIDDMLFLVVQNRLTNLSGDDVADFAIALRIFGVDVVEDFKEYTLRDYYGYLKTYCCWYKLKLLDNAADSRLRQLEESVAADDKMKK